jgi:hypothetical protein
VLEAYGDVNEQDDVSDDQLCDGQPLAAHA